jgi:hypothetical protein
LEPDDPQNSGSATPDDIRRAIEDLKKEDSIRLRKAALYCLYGTEYQNPQELINEAICRAMSAAHGERGRKWKISVPFMAFMIQTMRGIANDSQESMAQKKTDHVEAMATESLTVEDALGAAGHFNSGIEELVVEEEDVIERQALAKADSDVIDAHFANDSDVTWIIMGYKDGQTAAEIREISEMSATQYDTAKRRFRRGLEKLFPNRSKV